VYVLSVKADVGFLQYMEKRLFVQLNGNRKVIGVLRGYDVRLSSMSLPFQLPMPGYRGAEYLY